MLSILIKTENSVSNMLKVVGVTCGGEQFHMVPSPGGTIPAFPSVAEQTLKRYAAGDDSTKGSEMTAGSFVKRKCFGCGQPHPWSK